jgi:hypothetical protein
MRIYQPIDDYFVLYFVSKVAEHRATCLTGDILQEIFSKK